MCHFVTITSSPSEIILIFVFIFYALQMVCVTFDCCVSYDDRLYFAFSFILHSLM